jgi:hypothetical protein
LLFKLQLTKMKIYGVHPEDKNLNFFKRGIKKLIESNKESFQYLKLGPNYYSHENATRILSEAEEGLVIFFCHALDRSIRGCQIVHAAAGREERDFLYGAWISPTKNMEVFKGKNVFCLACNSNDIGSYALKAGARVFLGFDDISFYLNKDFKAEKVSANVKLELEKIVTNGLLIAIEQNLTFNRLAVNLRILFSNRYTELMRNKEKGKSTRIEVARVLLKIRSGIKVQGNGELKLK